MRNFDESYMKMAYIWAENSYAIRHKVGAIVVKDNRIISDGYNGTPSGFDNVCEDVTCSYNWVTGCLKTGHMTDLSVERSIEFCKGCECFGLRTKREVLHAEANALTKLAKGNESSVGATLYVTLSPCFDCAKLIIQSGIKRVVYNEEYRDVSGLELLKKAGVEVVFLNMPVEKSDEFIDKESDNGNVEEPNDADIKFNDECVGDILSID